MLQIAGAGFMKSAVNEKLFSRAGCHQIDPNKGLIAMFWA
jgi:hypothetical protein